MNMQELELLLYEMFENANITTEDEAIDFYEALTDLCDRVCDDFIRDAGF